MASTDPGTITALLLEYQAGDKDALNRLIPVVYEELQKIARGQLRQEFKNRTLSTSDLIHEAYLKFEKQENVNVENRSQFFGTLAVVMKHVLIDVARKRNAEKRGKGEKNVPLDEVSEMDLSNLVDLDFIIEVGDTLEKLEQENKQAARVVELKYFGDRKIDEIAEIMEISPATVRRRWQAAKFWLRGKLRGAED